MVAFGEKSHAGNEFTIISKGKTAYKIVLPVKPTAVEQTAAAQPVKDFIYMIKASTDTSSAFVSFRTDVFKENYINLDMAVKGNKLMEQALSKVKNDEVHSRRVHHFRTYFNKVIVNRNGRFKEEALVKGIDFAALPLDRKLVAQRIVSTLK